MSSSDRPAPSCPCTCPGPIPTNWRIWAPIPEAEPGEPPKSQVELLIERIQAIQQELPKHDNPYYDDELAFTQAAEEHAAQMEAAFSGTPGPMNAVAPRRKHK